jgi:hypothetical protein
MFYIVYENDVSFFLKYLDGEEKEKKKGQSTSLLTIIQGRKQYYV